MSEAKYLVMNIGCIECGVSSKVVGVFTDRDRAHSVASGLLESHSWREGGQNDFIVCELPPPDEVDEEYLRTP